jgi:protein transport protein SEC24
LVFASNIHSIGLGALTTRDDPKLYNTDKEKTLLTPANEHYTKLAQECVQQRIAIDIYYALNSYKSIDLASIAVLPGMTGGDLNYLSTFDITKHGEKLHYLLFRALTRNQGTDVQIKARVSQGLTVAEYFGGFTFKEQPDFNLSAIDADKSIGFLIRSDEKLKDNTLAFV